jgi:hypothetical protein
MVGETLMILIELGLPPELARYIVFRWKGVEHPVARAWKTDPWLNAVHDIYSRLARAGRQPSTVDCVCPMNLSRHIGVQRRIEHRHALSIHWSMVAKSSKVWTGRVRGRGPPIQHRTVRCKSAFICLRLAVHTMPMMIDPGRDINTPPFPGEDCVTGEDGSLATWLRHAPTSALREYLGGVSGWSEDVITERLWEVYHRQLPPRRCSDSRPALLGFIMGF